MATMVKGRKRTAFKVKDEQYRSAAPFQSQTVSNSHTVKVGETVKDVAKVHACSTKELVWVNNLDIFSSSSSGLSLLDPGMQLKIPKNAQSKHLADQQQQQQREQEQDDLESAILNMVQLSAAIAALPLPKIKTQETKIKETEEKRKKKATKTGCFLTMCLGISCEVYLERDNNEMEH